MYRENNSLCERVKTILIIGNPLYTDIRGVYLTEHVSYITHAKMRLCIEITTPPLDRKTHYQEKN